MKFGVWMKSGLWLGLALLASVASAQSPVGGGVASEWDVRKLLDSLDLQAQHVKPIIDQVKPQAWVAKGAPQAYVTQWTTAQAELNGSRSHSIPTFECRRWHRHWGR
jgi:hypothetical protein